MTPIDKKQFDSFDPHTKWAVLSPYLNDLKQAVSNRIGVLPQVAALAATLIVIASFNQELVPLSTFESQAILSVLLFMIPISLHLYIYDLEVAEKRNVQSISTLLGIDIQEYLSNRQTFTGKIVAYFPRVATALFYVLIVYISYRLWCG